MYPSVIYTLVCALLALDAAVAAPPARRPLRISAPRTITQCGIATFTWTETTAPYTLSVLRATEDDPSSFPGHGSSGSGNGRPSYVKDADAAIVPKRPTASWIVDYPAGTTVRVFVRDAHGGMTGTRPMIVQPGHEGCMDDDEDEEEEEGGGEGEDEEQWEGEEDEGRMQQDGGRAGTVFDYGGLGYRGSALEFGHAPEIPLWDDF